MVLGCRYPRRTTNDPANIQSNSSSNTKPSTETETNLLQNKNKIIMGKTLTALRRRLRLLCCFGVPEEDFVPAPVPLWVRQVDEAFPGGR